MLSTWNTAGTEGWGCSKDPAPPVARSVRGSTRPAPGSQIVFLAQRLHAGTEEHWVVRGAPACVVLWCTAACPSPSGKGAGKGKKEDVRARGGGSSPLSSSHPFPSAAGSEHGPSLTAATVCQN